MKKQTRFNLLELSSRMMTAREMCAILGGGSECKSVDCDNASDSVAKTLDVMRELNPPVINPPK